MYGVGGIRFTAVVAAVAVPALMRLLLAEKKESHRCHEHQGEQYGG